MESYEASKTVFTRVQNIDPENASKIMGYILLHHGEHDMLQLSFANEPFFLNLVSRAKSHLGLSSNTSSALLLNPVSDPVSIPRPDPLSVSLSSLGLSTGFDPSSPSSPSIWSPHHVPQNPNTLVFSSSSTTSAVDDFQLKDHNLGPFMSDPGVLSGKSSDFSDQSLDFSGDFNNGHNVFHRRSASFNDNMSYFGGGGSFGGGGGGGFSDDNYDAVYERQEQIFRAKLAHQQRLASQLMNSGVSLPYNKLNFLHSEAQRSAAALMMSEELNKLNRVRMARHELLGLDCNPASRQIYLTFPADSTFKEEDVSNYFNKFGPVQDVRIPYQQKRMFGFVTFIFPETVKIILAKGNPHFVCDSRVLVKPYKEKGKLPDKKQHQQHQFERGEFSCSSLSEHDREPYDFQLGGRLMYNAQEMLLRKKLEEAEYQHALELQERRLMNLQMFDLKNQQNQHSVSVGSPVPSPNRTTFSPFDDIRQDVVEENKGSSTESDVEFSSKEVNVSLSDSNLLKKEGSSPHHEENTPFERLDDVLPDTLFTSPAKSSANTQPPEINNDVAVPGASSTTDKDAPAPVPPSSSAANTALKSCFSETPRVSTEHDEAIGM